MIICKEYKKFKIVFILKFSFFVKLGYCYGLIIIGIIGRNWEDLIVEEILLILGGNVGFLWL